MFLKRYCFVSPRKSSTFAKNEMLTQMKRIGWIWCTLVGLLLSCGNNPKEFVVEGTINNLGGRPLYAVYETNKQLFVDTLLPDNGYIALRNSSPTLIPIQLYYADKTHFTKVYVKNGDRIELAGDGEHPFELTVEGSVLNGDLFEFNQTHKSLLQNWLTEHNKSQSGLRSKEYQQAFDTLQSAIVAYVNQKPNNPVSAILVSDYLLGESDKILCDSIIGLLDKELLTSPIAISIQRYQQFQDTLATDSILPKFQWVTPTDTIDYLDTKKARATLLYFQSSNNFGTARQYQLFMEKWSEKYPSDTLQLIEISLDRDSVAWREKVKSDTVKWERRWLQENYLAPSIQKLHIQHVPYLIVVDSLGKIVSRGLSPDSIGSYIEQIIYPDSLPSSNSE